MGERVGPSRRPAALAAGLALLMLAPLVAASPAGALDEARAERERLQERLDEAAEALADAEARHARLERDRDEVAERVASQRDRLAAIEDRLAVRVRRAYKHGATVQPLAVLVASDDPDEALERAGTVRRLVHGDLAEAEEVAAARTALAADEQRLQEREAELAEGLEQREAAVQRLEDAFEEARAVERRERAAQARRERAAQAERRADRRARSAAADEAGSGAGTAAPSGGRACPVGQPRSFSDTWGAARSGGRSHRGTDVLAPYGTPIHAIVDGVWDVQSPGDNAGRWAILRGDDGTHYWYLHLQSHTVGDGARVSAGQQTGTNGDTGNARGTPHLHFEQHRGGSSPVNPYPLLRQVC